MARSVFKGDNMTMRRGNFGFVMDAAPNAEELLTDGALNLIQNTLKLITLVGGLENERVRHTIIKNYQTIAHYVHDHRTDFPRSHWPKIYFTLREVPNLNKGTLFDDLFSWLLEIANDIQKSGKRMSPSKWTKEYQRRRKSYNNVVIP